MFEAMLSKPVSPVEPPPVLEGTWVKRATLPGGVVSGGSLCKIGNKLYHFGGHIAFQPTGSLYSIDLDTGAVVALAGSSVRRYHKALAFGTKMIVYGGWGDGSFKADVAIYDTVSNAWSGGAASDYPADRYYAGLWNNKMYYAGGLTTGSGLVTQGRVYDPAANIWALWNPTGVPQVADYLGGAAVFGDKIYLLGGYNTQTRFTEYNMLTGVGKGLQALPDSRYEHVAASGKRGIYYFGGTSGTAGEQNKVKRYDIDTAVWSTLDAIPFTLGSHGAITEDGTKIYVGCGSLSANDIWIYTP